MRYFNGEEVWYRRIYSKDMIEKKLGEIPSDAEKLRIPGLIERLVGEYYEVNQADKFKIEGDNFGLMILCIRDGAIKAVKSVSYSHMVRAP